MQSPTYAESVTTADRGLQVLDGVSPAGIAFGPFRLCPAEHRIERSGEPLKLGGRALDILIALVERAGEVVSQRELIAFAWPTVTVDETNLRFQVGCLRKALGDGQAGARHVITVPGRGYCFVSPVTRESGARASRPAARRVSEGHPLPPRLQRMVGRDAEVAALAAAIRSRRFVTVLGPGGIGKTTVAVAVGHALAAEYGVVRFVDLGQVTEARLVPHALASALGLAVDPDDPLGGLIAGLRHTRMLLVLDSCDHLIETAAELAEAISAQAADVAILATSREALRVEGEHVHRLAPLACPPVHNTLSATEALTFPAAQLFAGRVGATARGFVLQDADAPVVARICNKLDGVALAVELAAGHVEAYGIEGVEARLDSRLSLLWQGRRTAPPRHRTLITTFDWSYDLLAEPERTVLQRLRFLPGMFTLEDAQAAAGDAAADVLAVADVIASLVAKSLVVADTACDQPHYRLLGAIRAYLHGKVAGAGPAT